MCNNTWHWKKKRDYRLTAKRLETPKLRVSTLFLHPHWSKTAVDEAPKHLPAKLHPSKAFSKHTGTADPDFGDMIAILSLEISPSTVFCDTLVWMINIVQHNYLILC